MQFLCTRVQAPTVKNVAKLEKVLSYLKLMMQWTRAFDRSPFEHVETYIDALFATHEDGKSQSGCMVLLGNTLVHKACQKQNLVTKSSTEAELVMLADFILEGEMIEEFVMEMGTLMDDGLLTNVHLVYQDNQSTMLIEYKRTNMMLVDILTKPLGGDLFHSMVEAILGKHLFKHLSNRVQGEKCHTT